LFGMGSPKFFSRILRKASKRGKGLTKESRGRGPMIKKPRRPKTESPKFHFQTLRVPMYFGSKGGVEAQYQSWQEKIKKYFSIRHKIGSSDENERKGSRSACGTNKAKGKTSKRQKIVSKCHCQIQFEQKSNPGGRSSYSAKKGSRRRKKTFFNRYKSTQGRKMEEGMTKRGSGYSSVRIFCPKGPTSVKNSSG